MEKTSIFKYYAFGYNYNLLLRDDHKGLIKSDRAEDFKGFLESLNDLGLPVTIQAAHDLNSTIKEFTDNEDVVSSAEQAKLKRLFTKIDAVLDAEIQLKYAYILSESRYPIESLLSEPSKLLATNTYSSLSANAQRDFKLACVQVALRQPTAAAFHLMRALEEQVKQLYFEFKKTKRLSKPMWHPMVEQLRNKNAPKPTEKLLNLLDGIRNDFRNPTQHPGKFYSIDEAYDLLNQTTSALNSIHREIKAKQNR